MKQTQEFTAKFSSAHLYNQPAWSEEKNRAEFGRCYTEHGHGHNYRLVVGFSIPEGAAAPAQTEALRKAVLSAADQLDHRHLNFDIPEFQKSIPTSENIALYLLNKLRALNLPCPLKYVRVFETDDIWADIDLEGTP